MTETPLTPDTRDTSTKCVITCLLPGCSTQIHYLDTDDEIPLYCPTHLAGREKRGYRVRKHAPTQEEVEQSTSHMYRCPQCCTARVLVSGVFEYPCPNCGAIMVKHGEVK